MKKLIYLLIMSVGLMTACDPEKDEIDDIIDEPEPPTAPVDKYLEHLTDLDVFVHLSRDMENPDPNFNLTYIFNDEDHTFIDAKGNQFETVKYKMLDYVTLQVTISLDGGYEKSLQTKKIPMSYDEYGAWYDEPNLDGIFNGLWLLHEQFSNWDIYFAVNSDQKKIIIWNSKPNQIITRDYTIAYSADGVPVITWQMPTSTQFEIHYQMLPIYTENDGYHGGVCGLRKLVDGKPSSGSKNYGFSIIDDKTDKKHHE